MHRRFATKLAAWVCLIAYALTCSLVGAHGLVLCVGPNGHFELELASGLPCAGCGVEEWPAADSQTEVVVVGTSDPECPCVDTPIVPGISGPQAKPTQDRTPFETPAATPATNLAPSFLAPGFRSERLASRASPFPPRPSYLRTVVLLV